MSGDGRRLPAQCSPDGALVPPEIRCPVSVLPASRAQTPSSMPKCRCEQEVKRALCSPSVEGYGSAGGGSPAGRGVPAPSLYFRSRGTGRSESSSAASATPSQLRGLAQAFRFSAISGAQAPRPTGCTRVPAGPTRAAPGARSPGGGTGARPRAVSTPAAGVGPEGRQLLFRIRCDPCVTKRVAASGDDAEILGRRHRPPGGQWMPHTG
ncbi:hypothetical protein NDU88_001984 [Pleurodeles waltl]|uniref:Uncharacterized protein n=1 Tax=Pleurodeles waltl TaxID=8319 RepID=A0AAV7LED0_PLEWA|nr:hypothetical protein NDU88_001984 [Pleurodeles waltl]